MRIAIVGGGTTGLFLAKKLAEKGNEVTVFEKKEKTGKEVCSGFFSERILEFIPESEKLIENEVNFCFIHFPRTTIKLTFKKRFFVMDHAQLDLLLLDLAQKAGARVNFNYQINSLPANFERIIGCDGANSTIRNILGIPSPKFFLGIQGFLKKEDYSNFVETWPTKKGFLWKIPRGKEIEYGILEEPQRARLIFEQFLKKNNIFLERIKSAIIPQGFIIPKNEKITLCGDATGITKPWSGGGVIWGLTSAEILLKNFPDFLRYRKEMTKFFLPQILFSQIAKKLVYFLGFNFSFLLPKNFTIDGDFLFEIFSKN